MIFRNHQIKTLIKEMIIPKIPINSEQQNFKEIKLLKRINIIMKNNFGMVNKSTIMKRVFNQILSS